MDQQILDTFKETYKSTIWDPATPERIQQVKDALYRRSYIEAFSTEQNLEAYVVRWSPSRALAYAHIFHSNLEINKLVSQNFNALCIGGGAGAEIAALSTTKGLNQITTVDIADWEPVTRKLADQLDVSDIKMIRGNAMEEIPKLYLQDYNLITCLFTTNELVQQSKQQFVNLFRNFSKCPINTLIVVIESAGSYSEVQIGTKKFPVYFLLHYTLTNGKAAGSSGSDWELVSQTDSEWYRLPEGTKYPYELQNMRYFLRVYRKVK